MILQLYEDTGSIGKLMLLQEIKTTPLSQWPGKYEETSATIMPEQGSSGIVA